MHSHRAGRSYVLPDAFQNYKDYTGGVPDDDVGLLRITPEQYANLQSLFFEIGGMSVSPVLRV